MKNNFIHFLFLVVAVAMSAASCTKDTDPEIVLDEAEYVNISYGTDDRHRMDVYLPEGRDEETPVVVLIHGGAWVSGDRSDMSFIQGALNILPVNKVAFVNINYRFASETNHLGDMLDDVAQALATIKSNSRDWGIRDRNFSLLGVSSGAHLALTYAYGVQKPQEVKTVISIAGPTDLATLTTDPVLNNAIAQRLLGISPPNFSDPRYREASPLYQVAQAVPTLMLHGDADDVVPHAQSAALKAALDAKAIPNKLVTLPGIGHDLDEVNASVVFNAFGEIRTWIRTHGK